MHKKLIASFFVSILFGLTTYSLDVATALKIVPLVASALGGNKEQTIHHIHSTPSVSAEKLSDATEKLISKDLDVTLTEADILKVVPNHERETAVKRIALQRLLQKKLHQTIGDQGSVEAIASVVQEGANINGRYEHNTPLIKALLVRHDPAATFLLEQGASPRLIETSRNMTPLHAAAKMDNLSMTTLLVERYKVDINAKTKPSNSWIGSKEAAQTPYDMATGQTRLYLFNQKPPFERYGMYALAGAVATYYVLRHFR